MPIIIYLVKLSVALQRTQLILVQTLLPEVLVLILI